MACKVTARGACKCAQLLNVGTRSQCSPFANAGAVLMQLKGASTMALLRGVCLMCRGHNYIGQGW